MGLLTKALNRGKEHTPSPVLNKFSESTSFLAKAMSKTKSSFKTGEIPSANSIYSISEYFNMFQKYFSKGALLLKISLSSELLYPLCIKGYDKTTSNRLRFPANESIFTKSSYLLNKDQIKELEPFFSTREFGLVEQVIILPLIHDRVSFGCFIITETKESVSMKDLADKLFSAIGKDGNELFNLRYGKLPSTGNTIYKTDNLLFDLDKSLKEKSDFLLIELDINKYLSVYENKVEYINLSFISYDLINLLTSMFSGNGLVYTISTGIIAVIFNSKSIRNLNILNHQIILAVSGIFPDFNNIYFTITFFNSKEDDEQIKERYLS